MRRPTSSLVAALLLAAAGLAAGPQGAAAGDFADAKRTFKKGLESDDPAVRRQAFAALADHDGAAAVDEVASVLGRETDASVLLAGVRTLSAFRTPEATNAIVAAAKAAKGPKRLLLLVALRDQRGDGGKDFLAETATGTDPQAAAHAALGLGAKGVAGAADTLLGLLAHKDWQVRSAAARALAMLGKNAGKEAAPRLLAALDAAEGRDRTDLVDALAAVTGQDFQDDPAAWKALLAGTAPAQVARAPRATTYFAGVAVRGKRVVLILDHSNCTDDPHPFQERTRLQDVCKVPGARDVPWMKLTTTADFLKAHGARLVNDLPEARSVGFVSAGGPRLDVRLVRPQPATAGTKAAIVKEIESMKAETGLDVLGAIQAALDAGGKEPASWALGPDEIVYMGCGGPWLAPVKDTALVGAAAGLRARLRCVPVHMVGVGAHHTDMFRTIADLSGGRYVNLAR